MQRALREARRPQTGTCCRAPLCEAPHGVCVHRHRAGRSSARGLEGRERATMAVVWEEQT